MMGSRESLPVYNHICTVNEDSYRVVIVTSMFSTNLYFATLVRFGEILGDLLSMYLHGKQYVKSQLRSGDVHLRVSNREIP